MRATFVDCGFAAASNSTKLLVSLAAAASCCASAKGVVLRFAYVAVTPRRFCSCCSRSRPSTLLSRYSPTLPGEPWRSSNPARDSSITISAFATLSLAFSAIFSGASCRQATTKCEGGCSVGTYW